jgi:hypothetical protein
MKIGAYDIDNKWIAIGGAVLFAIIVIVYLSIPKTPTGNTAQILDNAAEEIKAPLIKQIADKDVEIKTIKNQLIVSDGKYKVLVKKYIDLQKEKDNVRPPTTNEELRSRYDAAGFPMLPIK